MVFAWANILNQEDEKIKYNLALICHSPNSEYSSKALTNIYNTFFSQNKQNHIDTLIQKYKKFKDG